MTIKNIVLFSLITIQVFGAKQIVDCRVMIRGVMECNPYPQRLQYVDSHQNPKNQSASVALQVISSQEILATHLKSLKSLYDEEKSIGKSFVHPKIKEPIVYGTYIVRSGDALSKIAKKFETTLGTIIKLNRLKNKSSIRIGQKLSLPLAQKKIESLDLGTYTVETGDTVLSIASYFSVTAKALLKFNKMKDAKTFKKGLKLKLPLPYILSRIQKAEKRAKKRLAEKESIRKLNRFGFGKHKLRVTATAYTSHKNQTDSTPFIAAWNNRIRPGMKMIAISRDLLRYSGIRNGAKVRISGLAGYYRVKDKMNKRYRKRIDIYMGLNLRKARKWGRRSVVIYW